MPTIEQNLSWGSYSWPKQGDEWSFEWGDAETQWYSTIFPRVRRFLPAARMLEIAPGFGRWTQFLIEQADEYIGVDLNEQCISACRSRFATRLHARFFANDGRSLVGAAGSSIDFAFSFDSLVHVEMDVIVSYLRELSRTLTPNGVAFLHHSNLGEYSAAARKVATLVCFAERLKYCASEYEMGDCTPAVPPAR